MGRFRTLPQGRCFATPPATRAGPGRSVHFDGTWRPLKVCPAGCGKPQRWRVLGTHPAGMTRVFRAVWFRRVPGRCGCRCRVSAHSRHKLSAAGRADSQTLESLEPFAENTSTFITEGFARLYEEIAKADSADEVRSVAEEIIEQASARSLFLGEVLGDASRRGVPAPLLDIDRVSLTKLRKSSWQDDVTYRMRPYYLLYKDGMNLFNTPGGV